MHLVLRKISRAGIGNYTPPYLWNIITCPCFWFLLLARKWSMRAPYICHSCVTYRRINHVFVIEFRPHKNLTAFINDSGNLLSNSTLYCCANIIIRLSLRYFLSWKPFAICHHSFFPAMTITLIGQPMAIKEVSMSRYVWNHSDSNLLSGFTFIQMLQRRYYEYALWVIVTISCHFKSILALCISEMANGTIPHICFAGKCLYRPISCVKTPDLISRYRITSRIRTTMEGIVNRMKYCGNSRSSSKET